LGIAITINDTRGAFYVYLVVKSRLFVPYHVYVDFSTIFEWTRPLTLFVI